MPSRPNTDERLRTAHGLLAATITDEGPIIAPQASKLWHTRGNFQNMHPTIETHDEPRSDDIFAILPSQDLARASSPEPPSADTTSAAPTPASPASRREEEETTHQRGDRLRAELAKELKAAESMARRCRELEQIAKTPSSDLAAFYEFSDSVSSVLEGINALRSQHAKVKRLAKELLARYVGLHASVQAWKKLIVLDDIPLVDTSM
jgi:hypothetical protein